MLKRDLFDSLEIRFLAAIVVRNHFGLPILLSQKDFAALKNTLLVFFVLCFSSLAYADLQRPNIVLIISDDQAWGDYSFMGHEAIQTPHLDRLARESLTFTRGYVPTSLCHPSLSSIISGLYPHQHGIVGNDPPWDGMKSGKPKPNRRIPPYLDTRKTYLNHLDAVTALPNYLSKLGYRSMQTGKWWEGNFQRGGFSDGMTIGDFTKDGRHGDAGLKIGRDTMEPIEDFLDSCTKDHSPYLLWYAPLLPHEPHNPPQRLLDKYKNKTDSLPMAKYWAMCEWFDETCGDFVQSIGDRGDAENTIIVYITDIGWINNRNKSGYAPRSKPSPNEGGGRTPMMIKWPKRMSPKFDQSTLVSSIDIVPTLLATVGVNPDPNLPRINLLDEKATQSRHRIYGEILDHDI
ncbi:Arylsulfatase precursor [Planctomycetes bacterium CA13]|uniref:Arylsulfatase n=1 Tax=Novipirellula herctigrandis TaxID=2527986 RepID=A0A5C5Z411_9BACT|nr:Arylsulfatase precursor [Planctomycetes bacterium CA13]